MDSKTICFFNTTKTWGGGEKWHYEMALFMHQNGFNTLFVTHPGSALHRKLSGSVECIPFSVGNLSFLNPFKIFRLKKIFKAHHVECIIINLSADLKLSGPAAKLAHVKRIIYRRGSAIPIRDNFLNRFYFKKILTDVIANSEATKETILQNNQGLFPENKIKVIYNPIHVQEFINRKYKPLYIKKNDKLVLANIGRLVPQKNQQFLIDLAVELKARKIPFKIIIAGSGPLEKKLKTEAKEKNVSQQIIFTGFLENVKDLLMSCDIFILPSLWEGFGYVLAEASLCKKPVIAFNISSNPELVVDNRTGFLCPVNKKQPVINKILIFKEDPQLANEFGENGFNFIKNKFADQKIKGQLSDYLS